MRSSLAGWPARILSGVVIVSGLLQAPIGCRTSAGDAPSEALTTGSEVAQTTPGAPEIGRRLLLIRDAETAASIFGKIKKVDPQKSSPTTKVWEGQADLECQVDTFEGVTETQCWMTAGVAEPGKRDYVFNFGDVDAEIIFDLMLLEAQELASIRSKRATGKIRLASSELEFSLSLAP